MKKNRVYTKEFRNEAVKLAGDLNSVPAAAEQLGIPEANIYKWKKDLRGGVTPKSPLHSTLKEEVSESQTAELKRLRKENQELKKVNYILKAAAAVFSQDHRS